MVHTEKGSAYNSPNSGKAGEASTRCQIELGSAATDYETYSGQSYTPDDDGTVNGAASVYPIITLLSDVENITIECEYNRDINKAFDELYSLVNS